MKMDNFFKVALGVGAAIMPTISQALAPIMAATSVTLSKGMATMATNPVVESAVSSVNPENMSAIGSMIYNNPGATLAAYGGFVAVSLIGIVVVANKGFENSYEKNANKVSPQVEKEGIDWGSKLKSFFADKETAKEPSKSLSNGMK